MSGATNEARSLMVRLAGNAVSLLASDVLNKATTFAVYAMISRYADPEVFGQLSLGLLLLYTFQVFACLGLPTLVTRDLAKHRDETGNYFVDGSAVVLGSSLLATVAMALFALAMRYSNGTTLVIVTLAAALVPYALAIVTESIFRAWERMHFIAIANVPANVVKVVGAFLLLRFGYGVIAVALLFLLCRLLILATGWVLFYRFIERPRLRLPRYTPMRRLALRATTFLGIDGLIAVWASVDVVLLSKLRGEAEVGLYSAAWQLLIPARLFFQSIVSSVFPVMCQKMGGDLQSLKSFVRWLVEFLLMIGLPTAIGIYFLAEPGLLLLYGDESFLASAALVRVLVLVLLLHTITSVFGHALWAGLREGVTLRIVAVNLVVNLIASYLLIQSYGVIGAAYGALLTWIVNGAQHYVACARLFSGMSLAPLAWKAAVAGGAMIGCFLLVDSTSQVVDGAVAAAAYLIVVAVLLISAHGGLRDFRTNYLAPLLK